MSGRAKLWLAGLRWSLQRHVAGRRGFLGAGKTFVVQRLMVSYGDPGAMTFFGDARGGHQMLAEHITAEYPVKTEVRGRECIEWKLRPGRDNHLLDCLAMASVAASVQGVTLGAELQAETRQRRRRVITKAQLPTRW